MDSRAPVLSGLRSFPTSPLAAAALFALFLAVPGAPAIAQPRDGPTIARGFPGAIFTTDSTCTVVDANIYDAKTDVYLNGGGKGVRLPDGSYYIQVTEPNGTVLGSSGSTAPIEVLKGKFAACYQVWALVGGFEDSRNGEYKVWVCQDATFSHPGCKTDNFRVSPSRAVTSTRTATSVPVLTATNTPSRTATATATSIPPQTATATPTLAPNLTATPAPTQTQTPITPVGGGPTPSATTTPIVSTATPTATRTATAIPTATVTAIAGIPTATATFGPAPGGPAAEIPTLSPAMLGLLAVGLGALGFYLTRR